MNDIASSERLLVLRSSLRYVPRFYDEIAADTLMCSLLSSIEFDSIERSMIRRPFSCERIRIPRMQSAYGDAGTSYRFSGVTVESRPWTSTLDDVRGRLRAEGIIDANFVLVSYYRDGADYMGWHSDDERDLGDAPTIASLSLGAERAFRFRHKLPPHESRTLTLGHGSLLVMHHPTNRDWKHALPKRGGSRPERIGPRLNLTFRRVEPVTRRSHRSSEA